MTHAINLGYTLEETRTPMGFGAAPAPQSAGGALISDDSDAGLVTIAGTGTGSKEIATAPGAEVFERNGHRAGSRQRKGFDRKCTEGSRRWRRPGER